MASQNRKRLTNVVLEKLKPADQRYEILDDIVRNLTVRVSPDGGKSFAVLYRVAGAQISPITGRPKSGPLRRATLGRYPLLGLSEAREKASDLLREAAAGKDPRAALAPVGALPTVANVVADYVEYAKRSVKSHAEVERVLRKHVVPHLGPKIITEVTRADCHAVLDRLVAAGTPGAARNTRKYMGSFFRYAVERDIVAVNPAAELKRADLKPNRNAGRVLTKEETAAIYQACNQLGYPMGDLYKCLLLSGQRRNEFANCRWDEVDLEAGVIEIPSERYKGRRDHRIMLTDELKEIVAGLPRYGDYLFTKNGVAPVNSWSKGKADLDREASVSGYRVHDFRVTAASRLAELGVRSEVRDAVLGHLAPGMGPTYNKYDYASEKREALEKYSAYVREVVDGSQ